VTMKAELLTLTETTDGFATAIIARGPGTGINRWQVRLVNEAAAAEYGLREAVVDFPNALDADHLRQLAEEHLARVSDPANFQELTVRVSGHDRPLRIGQRVRVSDGELGFTTTGTITSLDVTEDAATITLGGVPANLLDVVNRREEEERRQVALGLPAPDQVDVQPTPTGIIVSARAGVASRAVGLEVHVSTVNGFEPDASTRAARGPGTRFVIDGLPIGVRQYVRVRAYDDRGNFSPFTQQVSTVPRGVGGPELVAGTIELTNAERPQAALSVKTTAGAEVLRLGNITGKPGVPAGVNYGLWGILGSGVFVEGVPRIVYLAQSGAAADIAGNWSAGQSQTGDGLGIVSAITPITVPPGYRLHAAYLIQSQSIGYRVIDPPSWTYAAGFIESLRVIVDVRTGSTWTSAPYIYPAGTVFDAVRLSTIVRGTAYKALSGGYMSIAVDGLVMLMLIPES